MLYETDLETCKTRMKTSSYIQKWFINFFLDTMKF